MFSEILQIKYSSKFKNKLHFDFVCLSKLNRNVYINACYLVIGKPRGEINVSILFRGGLAFNYFKLIFIFIQVSFTLRFCELFLSLFHFFKVWFIFFYFLNPSHQDERIIFLKKFKMIINPN